MLRLCVRMWQWAYTCAGVSRSAVAAPALGRCVGRRPASQPAAGQWIWRASSTLCRVDSLEHYGKPSSFAACSSIFSPAQLGGLRKARRRRPQERERDGLSVRVACACASASAHGARTERRGARGGRGEQANVRRRTPATLVRIASESERTSGRKSGSFDGGPSERTNNLQERELGERRQTDRQTDGQASELASKQ